MKQNTTYKQTELGLIPEDWEVKKFNKFSKFYSGGTPLTSKSEYYGGEIPFIKSGEIYYDRTEQFLTQEGLNNSSAKLVYRGDLLYALYGANSGEVAISQLEGAINQAILCIQQNKDEAETIYLYNYLKLEKSNIINKFLQGGQGNLSADIIKNLQIPLPPLPEQKKIADCLSTWDVAIEKQSQLINALTDRKKALMQQLLTGKKRLPGFEGKWNLNSINDLFIFKNGKAHENDIDENGKYILVNSKFISTDGEILKKTNSNLAPLEVNDLVFVMSDVPNGKALAKFFLIKEDNLYTLNQRIGLLKIKKGNPIFMYYLLNRNAYFLMFDNGVGQTNLRKDDILDCPLNIPSLSEQTAIAEILTIADRELQLQKEKLVQLQTQKKGLMQVLLTGKKRLIN